MKVFNFLIWKIAIARTYNCMHEVVSGFNGMGDGLICIHCGLNRYPEGFPPYLRMLKSTPENMQLAEDARAKREAA